MRTKIFLLMSVLVVASLITGCAGVAAAQTEQPFPRTMNVNGTGKVYLVPDIAYINIGVHTENKNASEAVAANTAQTEKVIASLKAAGVDAKDVQTTNFSIYPQQKYDNNGQPTGEIVYMVDNTVAITVRDIEKLGELLDAAVKAGANNIYGITFDVSDKEAALAQARADAVANAQQIAKELADASGVTLGQVITISSYGGTPVPVYEGKGGGMASAEAASVPVSPGQMVLTVDVAMVYEIR
jgi:uncharacterized protein